MYLLWQILLVCGVFPAILSGLVACDECAEPGYSSCDPDGASAREVPTVGPDLGRLYLELLYTIKDAPPSSHLSPGLQPVRRDDGKNLCCKSSKPHPRHTDHAGRCSRNRMLGHPELSYCPVLGPQTLFVHGQELTRGQDMFTTNFYLTDGSFGSLFNGSYQTPAGDEANLISGEYKKATGETGNIYDLDPADKPDTSDLPIPTPFTSSGVGSAIPGSMLGATSIGMSTSLSTSLITSASVATESSESAWAGPNLSLITSTTPILTFDASPISVAAATSARASYGVLNNLSATAGASVTGTSGASMVSSFTSSPSICPPINVAAAQFIFNLLPRILALIVAATLAL